MMRETRKNTELRPVQINVRVNPFAEGSCLYVQGDTKIWCTASIDTKVPSWKKEGDGGWVTAEYAMLPRANRDRMPRESKKGQQTGRTMEISRLIGRAMRASLDLKQIEGLTVTIDCDVLMADGGTRCASICGAYMALTLALRQACEVGLLSAMPEMTQVAAVSVGLSGQDILLDLDYEEDSMADVDLNLVLVETKEIVEIQASSEGRTMSKAVMNEMVSLATKGIESIFHRQREALGDE